MSGVTAGLAPRPGSVVSERLRPIARHGAAIAAIALYAGFACYLTWPLVTNLSHNLYGEPGDPLGTMAFYRVLVEHRYNPFLPGTISQLSAPIGLPIPWPRDLASAPGVLSLYLLTAAFGPVAAYGIYTLAGYILTGAATFLLARRLTSNVWASLIAGWAFAFYPFAAVGGRYHPDLIQGWVLVMAVWRMLELLWRPTPRNGIFAGLAVVLAMWWTAYFILFAGVGYVLVTVTVLALAVRSGRLGTVIRSQAAAAAIILPFLVGLFALSKVGAAEGIGIRSQALPDLYSYGARPVEYLAPDGQSVLFGRFTGRYERLHQYGAGPIEGTIYVGLTLLAFAAVACIAAVRGALTRPVRGAVVVLSLLGLGCAVASMPPAVRLGGDSIPLPSHFIGDITTTWRIYTRFVVIVMVALVILAAIGIDFLARRRSRPLRIAITLMAAAAVVLDLWTTQAGHVFEVKTPQIYAVLARQPAGMVAEYPMAHAGVTLYRDEFFQGAYKKPTINGYSPETEGELLAFSLSNLAEESTIQRLATLGVKYVITNRVPLQGSWIQALYPAPGLRLIAQTSAAQLYTLDLKSANRAVATMGKGFVVDTINYGVPVAGLEAPEGQINLIGRCAPCGGTLTMLVDSPKRSREITVVDSAGHALLRKTLNEPMSVSLPVRFDRRATLTVHMRPGLPPESSFTKNKTVTLRVAEPEFVSGQRVLGSDAGKRKHGRGGTA